MKKYLRMNERTIGITAGARYEVIEEDARTYRFIDDDGDSRTWSKEREGEFFTLEVEFSAPISGVTALPDESLGGVLREYREVKRKAAVGERIVFDANRPGITAGKPYDVVGGDHDGAEFIDDDGDTRWQTHVNATCSVLEPTDIIRVGDERLRMVDRKAAVGERVIIVNAVEGAPEDYGYDNGQVYVVMGETAGDPDIWTDGTEDSAIFLNPDEYCVLEPVGVLGQDYAEFISQVSEIPELSSRPASDQIAENIATLTAKVLALESAVKRMNTQLRVAREDIVLIEEGVADDIAELRDKVAALEKAQYNTPQPVYAIPRMSGKTFPVALKTPQQVRDETVERAKADVRELADSGGVYRTLTGMYTRAEFVINKEKRKVTAVLRGVGSRMVRAVGRAKCAPNDVFNAHIGRAIALRRALGLEVPAEYLSVPAPETVRVGDVVRGTVSGVLGAVDRIEGAKVYGKYESGRNMHTTFYEIYDDTREEENTSSAQKGAAAWWNSYMQ